jgi:hypothetical protein
VSVEFIEPEGYRDIKPGNNQSRASYQKHVLKHIGSYFEELAPKLPAKQSLKVKVTDIDLAGEVLFNGGRQQRIVKDLYFPRLKFSYQLVDEQQGVLSEGEAEIKDMNFLRRIKNRTSTVSFPAEQWLVEKWYKDTFEQEG